MGGGDERPHKFPRNDQKGKLVQVWHPSQMGIRPGSTIPPPVPRPPTVTMPYMHPMRDQGHPPNQFPYSPRPTYGHLPVYPTPAITYRPPRKATEVKLLDLGYGEPIDGPLPGDKPPSDAGRSVAKKTSTPPKMTKEKEASTASKAPMPGECGSTRATDKQYWESDEYKQLLEYAVGFDWPSEDETDSDAVMSPTGRW